MSEDRTQKTPLVACQDRLRWAAAGVDVFFRFGTFDELQARLAGLVEARKPPADPSTSGGADG